MQGRLRNQRLSVLIRTECAHCRTPLELEVSSELACEIKNPDARPVAFIPGVDLLNLEEESIINAF